VTYPVLALLGLVTLSYTCISLSVSTDTDTREATVFLCREVEDHDGVVVFSSKMVPCVIVLTPPAYFVPNLSHGLVPSLLL
jgi:hypothetical protein